MATPKKTVYYYECSNGEFRLVYFMPFNMLKQLSERGEISKAVLEDFPDGVDLDCTEPDFIELHDLYNYRPPISPDAMRRAFYTLFSSTHDWKNFQGSGFISAEDIEKLVDTVDNALQKSDITLEEVQPLPQKGTLKQRRKMKRERDKQQIQVQTLMEEMSVDWIDSKQTLNRQKFSPIEMDKGERAEDIFSRLHQKRKRR